MIKTYAIRYWFNGQRYTKAVRCTFGEALNEYLSIASGTTACGLYVRIDRHNWKRI